MTSTLCKDYGFWLEKEQSLIRNPSLTSHVILENFDSTAFPKSQFTNLSNGDSIRLLQDRGEK
jgi:hypothetical protein